MFLKDIQIKEAPEHNEYEWDMGRNHDNDDEGET
jgi:hypothetical protein